MKTKDFAPLVFAAHPMRWTETALKMCDRDLTQDIIKKMWVSGDIRMEELELPFFQSEMEEVMCWLGQNANFALKQHFQSQIDKYIIVGGWI